MHSGSDSGSSEFEYDPLSDTQINRPGGGGIGTAPDRISVYRLEAEIGRGGMGVVYQAIDSTLQRRVALKLLLHSAQIDVTSVKRFHNEALAAAKLSHPNIVHVHNVGEDKGIHFIAMQFIDGSNLQQIMKRIRDQVSEQHPVAGSTKPKERDQTSPMTPGGSGGTSAKSDHDSGVEWSAKDFTVQRSGSQLRVGRRVINGVAKLGADVADALQHAHEMGIIHRDIKPSNLILEKSGRIWVSDFGLAHISTNPGLTRTGAVLGTYRYMSPEQAAGNHHFLDHRSDVYSLGATLFEMIALRPAYDQQGSDQILKAIMYAPTPSLSKICRDVPADLSLILETAMAKNPADRYATAGEMAEDLRRFLTGQPVKASPLPAWKRVKYWISRHQKLAVGVVAGLVCAMLTSTASAFLLFGAFEGERAARQETEKALQVSEGLRSLANAGLQLEKSPGLSLALALNAEGAPLLEQRQAIQEAWDRCHEYAIYEYPAGVASMVRCSRDGSRVVTCAYLGQTSDGGPSCRIHDTKDGSLLVAIDSKDAISSAVFSPDGRYVLTATEPPREEGRSRLQQMSINPCLYDAQTGKFVRRFEGMTIRKADETCFSPDGQRLLLCRGGDAVIVDLSNNQQILMRGEATDLVFSSFSSDGRKVLTLNVAGNLRVLDAESLKDTRPALKLEDDPWTAKIAIADSGQKIIVRDSKKLRLFDAVVDAEHPETIFPARDEQKFCESKEGGLIAVYGSFGEKVLILSPEDFQVVTEIPVEGRIESVAMEQNLRLVAVNTGNEVCLFDIETAQLLSCLRGHTQKILDVTFHAQGSAVFTGANDGTLRMWRVLSGHQRESFPRDFDDAEGFRTNIAPVVSRDGKYVALSSVEAYRTRFVRPDGTCLPDELSGALVDEDFRPEAALLTTSHSWRVHDVATGKLSYQRRSSAQSQPDSAILSAGTRMLQRIVDSDAYLVNLDTKSRIHLRLESEDIRDSDVSLDQSMLLVSTTTGTCRLYDAASGDELWQESIHSPISDATLSSDNSRVAAMDVTGKVTIWNRSDSAAPAVQFLAPDSSSILFLNNSHVLVWHHALDKSVRCFDVSNGQLVAETSAGEWSEVVVHKTKPLAIVNSSSGAKLWEPVDNKESIFCQSRIRTPRMLSESIAGLLFDKNWQIVQWPLDNLQTPSLNIPVSGTPLRLSVAEDESLLGVSIEEYMTLVHDRETGRIAFRSAAHTHPISLAGFDEKGQTLVTVSSDGTVGFTRATGEKDYVQLSEIKGSVSAQLSPDGTILTACDENGMLSILGVNERRPLEPVKFAFSGAVQQIRYGGSSRFLAIAYKDGRVLIADLQTREVKDFPVHEGLRCIDFSDDGKTLLLSGKGPLIALDVSSGEEKPAFENGPANVIWSAYSPDGKAVALITADNELEARSLDGGVLLRVNVSAGRVLHAAFHPDGRHLVTSHPEKMLIWDLQSQAEVYRVSVTAGQAERFSRNLEWNPFVGDTGLMIWDMASATMRSTAPETLPFQRKLTRRECSLLRIPFPSVDEQAAD
ncbi:MAG: protein kinase [Planctomycetaceae bacterium]